MACIRLAAWSQTADWGPSITSAVTSSPRWAGRQWRKRASGRAAARSPRVDGVTGERGAAAFPLAFLAHGRPHVGVDGVHVADGLVGVRDELDGPAEVAGAFHELVFKGVAGR